MWLFYALLGPPFWALVHILDSHCVGNVFERPWMGVITSSLATAFIAVISLPLMLTFSVFHLPDWHIIGLSLLAGVLIQLGQSFYFHALEKTEAGIVAAYGNFTPTLLPLLSYLVLGDVLEPWHYITIGVLVLSSISFCLIDVSRNGRCDSILLMLLASTVQVVAIMIEKWAFQQEDFSICFAFIILGVISSGVLPLVFAPKVRNAFRQNLPTIRPLAPLFVCIELANLVALFMSQRAIDLGSPSMAAAMETTVPGYTFLLTILLLSFKHRFGDEEAKYKLRTKLILVGIMTVGVAQLT